MNALRFARTVFLVLVLFIVSAVEAYAHEGPDGSIPDSQGAIAAASVMTVQVTPNPDLVAGCGLRLVLVLDESGSIDTSAQAQVRTASQGFLTALAGTGSQAAVIGFAETADTPVPYTVIDAASIAPTGAFGQYLALSGPGPQYHDGRIGTYTNWEAAFQQVNNLPVAPDLVVFMTDGFPNTVVGGSAGGATTSAAIDAAAVRANVTKSNSGNAGNGSHIFAVGVGSGVSVDNMKPILDGAASLAYNGTNFPAADYVVGSFSTLLADLQDIANALCGGTITVEKVFDPDGNPQTTDDRYPVEGWTFTLTVAPPASAPTSAVTGPDGKVNFEIDFGGESTATAAISEQLGQGQTMIEAACEGGQNNGTISGNGISGIVLGNADIVKCTFVNTDGPSAIQVTKTANPTVVAEPGDLVLYTFLVENLSFGDFVEVQTLYDNKLGDLDGQGTCLMPQTLPPGGSYACGVEVFVAGNPGDSHHNVVVATGVDDDGYPVEDDDDARVSVSDVPSVMVVEKSATPQFVEEPGASVLFEVLVRNPSTTVDVFTVQTLVDSVYGDLNGVGTCTVPQVLAPGDTYGCEFEAQVNGQAGFVHTNTVTASSVDDDGNALQEEDDATVEVLDVPSSMDVYKNAIYPTVYEPGAMDRFTVVVQNTSAVDSLTILSITDDIYGSQGGTLDCVLPTTIPPGGVFYCAFDGYVGGEPGNVHVNTATVVAVDDDENQLEDTAQAEVEVLDVPSEIEVIKTPSTDQLAEPGDWVTFTFTVTNLSQVDEVTLTQMTDDVYGDLNGQGTCSVPQTLPVGASYTCEFTAQVNGQAGFVHVNTVTVVGVDDDQQPVEDDDTATVRIDNVESAVELVKAANPTSVPESGGNVTFTFEVVNTSPVDELTIVSLVDSVYGDLNGQGTCSVPQTLPVGASYSCALVAYLTGNAGDVHENLATVWAVDDDQQELTASDNAIVEVTDVPSSMTVVKTANPTSLPEPGGPVDFTVVVSNTSEVDGILIVALVDDVYGDLNGLGSCVLPQWLEPGASYACEFTQQVVGNPGDVHHNVVLATGVDDDEEELQAVDDATVEITDVPSSISVVKTASESSVPETGADVTFVIEVTNTSQTDSITIVTVVDDVFGDVSASCDQGLPVTLLPGEVLTCTFTRFITGSAGETHTNVATATGTDDDGNPVQNDDSVDVPFEDLLPSARIIKVAAVESVTSPGADVEFQIQVDNLGPEPLTLVSLNDSVYGDLNSQGTCSVPQSIPVGGSYTCVFTAYVAGQAGEVHRNVVTMVGQDDDGNTVTETAEETIIIGAPTAIDDDTPEPNMPWWSLFLPLIMR